MKLNAEGQSTLDGDDGYDRQYSRFHLDADEAAAQNSLQMTETDAWVMADGGTGTVKINKAALRD